MQTQERRVELVVENAGDAPRRFPLQTSTAVLGRGSGCELLVRHDALSRRHLQFSLSHGTVTVEDLGSLNGTLVNGNKIDGPVTIGPSDRITIGELTAYIEETEDSRPPDPSEAVAWLVVRNTHAKGRVLTLSSSGSTLGRARGSDVSIRHATISRKHARFAYDAKQAAWVVEDQGSANGTYVDDVQVATMQLSHGQKLRLGDVDMLFYDRFRPPLPRPFKRTAVLLVLLFAAIGMLAASILVSVLD
jgi:pSer/pThr/pTyr-binding forkhead associated (FHA) protein